MVLSLDKTGPASEFSNRISLDGVWSFRVESDEVIREIEVPGDWQSQFPDLRDYAGKGTYQCSFVAPEEWSGKAALLHFGAVDYRAEAFLNGHKVGCHEGGYTPFKLQVEDSLRIGEANDLMVVVTDPGPGKPVDGLDFNEIPHGKQSWYGNVSGIWQSVYIEARSFFHISRIQTTPDIDEGIVDVRIIFSRPADGGEVLHIHADVPDDAFGLLPVDVELLEGDSEFTITMAVPDARLWSPEHPDLYRIIAAIEKDGDITDEDYAVFGMRKIEAKDGRLLLNNKPFFLISALDQDFYPLTQYTPPSSDYIKEEFLKAKHLGLNSLRCHIKVPDPRYLDWADRLGLLIWYEIPNWEVPNEKSKERARQTLDEMVERDWNHPSLVMISIANESWGLDLSRAEDREWLKKTYDYAKSLNTGRLIVDNSPCGGNFHIKTDVEDYHVYYSIPDHYREFASWVADFSRHPEWTFSLYNDAVRTSSEPLVISEFGNWGLPSIRRLTECYGEEPWWFKTSSGATRPEGALERFKLWQLDKVFGDWDGLAKAFQDQEWQALKFEIEEMRKYPSIVGYVITEFTDLQWESNGLLDYCRNPKSFYDIMHIIQSQDIIIPERRRTSYWSGEHLHLMITVSHFSQMHMENCTLRWKIDNLNISGELTGISVEPGNSASVGRINAVLPEVERSVRALMNLELIDPDKRVLAQNEHEILVIPRAEGRIPVKGAIYTERNDEVLKQQGAILTSDPAKAELLLLDGIDETTLKTIHEGAVAIVVAEDERVLMNTFGGPRIEGRYKHGWWGDWCGSLIWFEEGLFDGLPSKDTLDFAFSELVPSHVITGYDPTNDRNDILSGLFVGWLRNPADIVTGCRCGKGKVLLTTLPFTRVYGGSPFATSALHRLMEFALSSAFKPKKTFDIEFLTFSQTFVPTAEDRRVEWRYTTRHLGKGWQDLDFDDSHWKVGRAGFGTEGTPNALIGTRWDAPDVWLRYEGEIKDPVNFAELRFFHDDGIKIYLNGAPILKRKGFITYYESYFLPEDALKAVRQGRNILAVHCHQRGGGQFVDVGLRVGKRGEKPS